jgi:hypothetical protein
MRPSRATIRGEKPAPDLLVPGSGRSKPGVVIGAMLLAVFNGGLGSSPG